MGLKRMFFILCVISCFLTVESQKKYKGVCEKGRPLPNINCGGIGGAACKKGYYCENGRCCQIPCKNGSPHPTLTCGMVVGSNQCPAGYSCLAHPADAFFACCPDAPKCGPVCAMACPFGKVLDKRGCPICKCKKGRTGK